MTSETALKHLRLAEQALSHRDVHKARAWFAKTLQIDRSVSLAREGLKKCVSDDLIASPQTFASHVASSITASAPQFIKQAFAGWMFTHLIDRQYIDANLASAMNDAARPRQEQPFEQQQPFIDVHQGDGPDALLEQLGSISNPESLYEQIQAVVASPGAAVVHDSFYSASGGESPLDDFDASRLNILVIGGGCAGLTLANALKLSLGELVDILIVENRVHREHIKKNYSRDWLTFTPISAITGLVDVRVTDILNVIGQQGYIGAPINVLETLLLLSCKSIGVKFWFTNQFALKEIQSSDAHLVFDATGGRLPVAFGLDCEPKPGPKWTQHDIKDYGRGFAKFGITNRVTLDEYAIKTSIENSKILPSYEQQATTIANLKITAVPIGLFGQIVEFVKDANHDSKFYVWPGFLHSTINRCLIIINLSAQELHEVSRLPREPRTISDFLLRVDTAKLDTRLSRLLKFIVEHGSLEDSVSVDPPYLYTPYVRPYDKGGETLHKKPLIRVGDSIFNGNPKVGNGLNNHLLHIQQIHDIFLAGTGGYSQSQPKMP